MDKKRYVLITMILSAAAAAGIFSLHGSSVESVLKSAAAIVLIAIAVEDAMTKQIHDVLLFALAVIAFADCFVCEATIANRLAGAVCVSLPMIAVNGISHHLNGKDSFGSGDVILCCVGGFIFGIIKTLYSCATAFICAGGLAAYLLISGRAAKNDVFAFGPFLCAGFILAIAF